jgi:hypothetical protein
MHMTCLLFFFNRARSPGTIIVVEGHGARVACTPAGGARAALPDTAADRLLHHLEEDTVDGGDFRQRPPPTVGKLLADNFVSKLGIVGQDS